MVFLTFPVEFLYRVKVSKIGTVCLTSLFSWFKHKTLSFLIMVKVVTVEAVFGCHEKRTALGPEIFIGGGYKMSD